MPDEIVKDEEFDIPRTDSSYELTRFSADSALIRELGERLVGQAHIALAELIKNAYDADATLCIVNFSDDQIYVTDNGHGMDVTEFHSNWMRIGTRHKQENRVSRSLQRPVTGSKGVGRLSAQFLAHQLMISTSSEKNSGTELVAFVDWDEAVEAGNITEAKALFKTQPRERSYANGSRHGATIVMQDLKQSWTEKDLESLAKELWLLQPPLGERFGKISTSESDPRAFNVRVTSKYPDHATAFQAQTEAALENWMAAISGEIKRNQDSSVANVTVQFRDGGEFHESFKVDPVLSEAKWQIRIFNLQGRQGHGISVDDARKYFETFGGVQVFDAGFRLPYYGVKQDWLNLEYDHSHRRNKSALLPEHLHVRRALNDLPTQGRIFGVVHINTGKEAQVARSEDKESGEFLKIQVTRDRLVSNKAYQELRDAVRWSIDFYATRQRIRQEQKARLLRPKESSDKKLVRLQSVFEDVRAELPDEAARDLAEGLNEFVRTVELEHQADDAARALLGPLASAGMAALAIEHESRKQIKVGRSLVRRLKAHVKKSKGSDEIEGVADALDRWIDDLESVRRVFSPLLEEEDRETVEALRLRSILTETAEGIASLIPMVEVTVDQVPNDIMLPVGTYAEWNALFQNVFVNSANAMLDKEKRIIECVGGRSGKATWVKISDTGVGIDLENADGLFEPFNRRVNISEERKALGLGGMGLGLTIVRMIAEQRHCKVSFVEPVDEFNTTFQMTWS